MHLLRVPKSYEDESINGYIQRSALENDYENANWPYSLKGINKSLKKSPSIEKEILLLSSLLNIEQDKLIHLTFINLFSFRQSHLENFKFLFKDTINNYSKYCPQCFKDENYQNKFWDIRSFHFITHREQEAKRCCS